LKDRCFYYELSFTYEQRTELIKALAEKGLGYGIDKEQRKEMADWLYEVTQPGTDGYNLRTFEKALKHYNACLDIDDGIEWKEMIRTEISIDENLEVARELLLDSEYGSTKERKKEFSDRLDKSGRTFLRAKSELVENSEKIKELVESRK